MCKPLLHPEVDLLAKAQLWGRSTATLGAKLTGRSQIRNEESNSLQTSTISPSQRHQYGNLSRSTVIVCNHQLHFVPDHIQSPTNSDKKCWMQFVKSSHFFIALRKNSQLTEIGELRL
jgi:hypothetical protein